MNTAELVQIITPQKYILNGFWFGVQHPHRAVILTHGLTSNAFANHDLVVPLADSQTGVLTYSNRGSEKIARFKRVDKRRKKGYTSCMIGEAHEVFTDCIDDIQGAVNFAKAKGAKEIILIGHSTGSQKTVYYLSKRTDPAIKGAVLLSPLSDFAGVHVMDTKGYYEKAKTYAEELVQKGMPHELIPTAIWPYLHDAQRFLSLYTAESKEEVFCYATPHKRPRTLLKIKKPLLVVVGGDDSSADRPIRQIVQWFQKRLRKKQAEVVSIPHAPHNFYLHEREVVSAVSSWISRL
jgi:alpha-beta hydrolase superfamily lysophospholipase